MVDHVHLAFRNSQVVLSRTGLQSGNDSPCSAGTGYLSKYKGEVQPKHDLLSCSADESLY